MVDSPCNEDPSSGWRAGPRLGIAASWPCVAALLVGLAVLAVAAAVALASFHAVGGSLNVDATKDAFHGRVADVGGAPYVAWQETNGTAVQIRVARFDGASWVAVAGSLNVDATKDARDPSVADVAGGPYVAWAETNGTANQVRVARFDGTSWVAVGGSLNVDPSMGAIRPRVADVGGVPYVAWDEPNATADQIRVKRFDGTSWVAVGGSLNADSTKDASFASIANVGGVPYVAWREFNGTAEQVRVARFDGTSWVAVGGSLNVDPTKNEGDGPNIANVGGAPYVTWREFDGTAYQVRVKRFDGTNWVAVGGSLNVDPTKNAQLSPSIADVGGAPYVTWQETNGTADQVRVARFDGTSWVAVGGSLNVDPTKAAQAPNIADLGGAPYVAWQESNGTASQVRVARDLAPSCSGGSVAVAHDTATSIPLRCGDADGDLSTLAIATGPAHGTLSPISQGAGTVTYTPSPGYTGPDSFSFKANDGALDANVATATLSVAPPPANVPIVSPRALVCSIDKAAQAKARSANVLVMVHCDQAAALTLAGSVSSGKARAARHHKRHHKHKPKRLTIAATAGTAAPNTPVTLTLRLSGKAAKQLKHGKRVALTLKLTARNNSGQTSATTANLSVKGKRKKKKKH